MKESSDLELRRRACDHALTVKLPMRILGKSVRTERGVAARTTVLDAVPVRMNLLATDSCVSPTVYQLS
jgi:hypothetical protein